MKQIQCNAQTFEITETITTGMTATVYRTTCGHVLKVFRDAPSRGHIDREHFWLSELADTGIAPRPLAFDAKRKIILMTDSGDPVSAATLPEDWRTQIERILTVLETHKCNHNDLTEQEVLVRDGKLQIIDFGFASEGEDMTCGGRFADDVKGRLFADTYITTLLAFLIEPHQRGSELHTFVLWDTDERERVTSAIEQHFTIVRAITYNPKTMCMLGRDRIDVLTRFYHGRISDHGEKGARPFVVYVVLDLDPVYAERTNAFTGHTQIVNTRTFDLLQMLRKGRTSFIHGSDNIQESYENLQTLTLYKERIPVCYWEHWRPSFASFADLFTVLNATPDLSYVVLRNFERLPADTEYGKHNDLDILVNDYYLFKRITGALSYKHKRPKAHARGGPAVEYGGYKVAGKVSIGGREVSVDVRFVGDNYYPISWEKDILHSRVEHNGFFIPNPEHHFYTLLYHACVHKRSISDTYRVQLTEMASQHGVLHDTVLTDAAAWKILDTFMNKKSYQYVRPDELTLPFTARDRAGISIADDMAEARTLYRSGKYVAASHLLRQVLADEPWNLHARMQLALLRARLFLEEEHRLPLKRALRRIKLFYTR